MSAHLVMNVEDLQSVLEHSVELLNRAMEMLTHERMDLEGKAEALSNLQIVVAQLDALIRVEM